MRDNIFYYQDPGDYSENPQKRLAHEVDILYGLLPATQWIELAVIAVIFGLLLKYVSFSDLVLWFLFALIIVSSRIAIREKYNSTTGGERNVQSELNRFLLGATLYGVMWSATAILLVPSHITIAVVIAALILCGLTAAKVAISSVNLRAYTVYTIATLWPYSFYLISSMQYPQYIIGVTIFLFSFIIFLMGSHTNRFFNKAIDMEIKARQLGNELNYEIRKRKLAENALLDNTLEEELAEKIRQHSLELKEGYEHNLEINPVLEKKYAGYIQVLDLNIKHQLQNTLVFVREIGEANIPERIRRDVRIVDKLLTSIISSIKKASMDEDHIKQELLEIDYEENKSRKINIRRMINYLVQSIPLVYKAKYITINKKINKAIPENIYGNNEALKKILLNLVTNAVKYSDGGTVDISIDIISEPGKPDDGEDLMLKFTITDTGIGMKRDAVEFLEDENNNEIGKYPGLAVIKYLASKNAMGLSVKTTLGVGTKIEFNFPCKSENKVFA